tara:strand:- start:112 stop:282 length:171 start_codon:yes stop_codon:yes gene_type:complete
MANYDVSDFTEQAETLAACLALVETKLDSIDDSKTIRLLEIHKVGNKFQYALIIDA